MRRAPTVERDSGQVGNLISFLSKSLMVFVLCYIITSLAEEVADSDVNQRIPDVVVVDVVITGISSDRQGSYIIRSQKMQRFPENLSDELIEPVVEQRRNSGEVRYINANFAEYLRESRTMTFSGNVVMKESDANQGPPTISRFKKLTSQLDEWE